MSKLLYKGKPLESYRKDELIQMCEYLMGRVAELKKQNSVLNKDGSDLFSKLFGGSNE
jgi:hypothetical protein